MKSSTRVAAATLVVAVGTIVSFAMVSVRAQSKPPGYLVVEFQVTDPVGWKAYADAARALPTSGKPIVRATKGVALSGEEPRTDLPGFFGPVISGKMALRRRGADEEEPIHRRADGGDPAGG
jgi:hypothetical protein